MESLGYMSDLTHETSQLEKEKENTSLTANTERLTSGIVYP